MDNSIFNNPKRVGFKEAISRFFTGYVKFSGRSSRSEYWFATLFVFLYFVGIGIITAFSGASKGSMNTITDILFLPIFLPSLAVGVRRLHDTGKSGWLTLIGIIPFASIVLLVFYCIDGEAGSNQYGDGYLN